MIGIAEDPLEASVQIFHVRRGRVVGHRGFVAEKVEDLSPPEFMLQVLSQFYGAVGTEVPRRVLVPEEPADLDLLLSWLGGPCARDRSTSPSPSGGPSGPCRRP